MNEGGLDDRYDAGDYGRWNPEWHESDAAWKAAKVDAFLRLIEATEYTVPSVELGGGGPARRVASWPRRAGRRVAPGATARLLGGLSLLVLAHGR